MAWPRMENLGELQFRTMGVPASGISKLITYFPNFPNLRRLNLIHGNIDKIDFDGNQIAGSELLAENLCHLKNLTWFSVHGNDLNSTAIMLLVVSLTKNCPHLIKVIFSKNNFDGKTINSALRELFARDSITNESKLPSLIRIDFCSPPPGEFESPTAQENLIRQVADPFRDAPKNFGRLGLIKYDLPVEIMKKINGLVQSYKKGATVVF